MSSSEDHRWVNWAREVQAIAQTGLHFSTNDFDRKRYRRLAEIAGEIFSAYIQVPAEGFTTQFFAQTGYATPKVDVRAAVFQNDKILLVQERSDGCWSMPGGWADVNEAPAAMVEREAWEESGFQVHARKLIGVYEANRDRDPLTVYYAYKLVFLCDIVKGEATPSDETSAVDFFALDKLPPFSAARTNLRHIQEAYAHRNDPSRPAAFD
ncbi:MAG: NUDIX hydrolase [Chloroflexi bacterium]|nr:NUDIX hydrolase [Chloroflexota bacterium]